MLSAAQPFQTSCIPGLSLQPAPAQGSSPTSPAEEPFGTSIFLEKGWDGFALAQQMSTFCTAPEPCAGQTSGCSATSCPTQAARGCPASELPGQGAPLGTLLPSLTMGNGWEMPRGGPENVPLGSQHSAGALWVSGINSWDIRLGQKAWFVVPIEINKQLAQSLIPHPCCPVSPMLSALAPVLLPISSPYTPRNTHTSCQAVSCWMPAAATEQSLCWHSLTPGTPQGIT